MLDSVVWSYAYGEKFLLMRNTTILAKTKNLKGKINYFRESFHSDLGLFIFFITVSIMADQSQCHADFPWGRGKKVC